MTNSLGNLNKKMIVEIQVQPMMRKLSVVFKDPSGLMLEGSCEIDIGMMYEGDEAIVHGLFKDPVDIMPVINKFLRKHGG